MNSTSSQIDIVRLDELYRGKGLPNAMSVDVEDYFQVSAFEKTISRSDWADMPSRINRNIDRVLTIFDEYGIKATFFTLGWVAERFPDLVRRIANEGHEIASHGYEHSRVTTFQPKDFLEDVRSTRQLLEHVSGVEVTGYRAPSFSIGASSLWAHDVLLEAGYQYSSSIFPISHDHYGFPGAPRFPFRTSKQGILEIPPSTLSMFGRNWPCAGGGYFRLFPITYSKWAIGRINQAESMPAIFYFHPWELDPEQPRVKGVPREARFRHYLNLDKFEARLKAMLVAFEWQTMQSIFLGRV
jgi:polysaccharide deacetylase family protein (PEP-CTERM system associated)